MRLLYSNDFLTLLAKMMDRDYYDYGNPIGIRSTAGAVPVMNEKGIDVFKTKQKKRNVLNKSFLVFN